MLLSRLLVSFAFLPFVLGVGSLSGCAGNRAACEADCESRLTRCSTTDVNCRALCATYIELGDPAGCADERLVYQGCVVDAACTTNCDTEANILNACLAQGARSGCFDRCRERISSGCGDTGACAALCQGTEYLGRATGCQLEVARWNACLASAPVCDLVVCLSELNDANNCRNAYCAANPTEPSCP